MNTPSASKPSSPTASEGARYRGPFALMTVLFFMWGFMTVWNDILIPRFKEAFTLSYVQAALVQFAFFGAYTVGSFIYFLISMTSGDPINRIGYKNGVVIGLLISALGTGLFYPAAMMASYPFFLGALFVVGLGFAMLQIAANPYVTILGPERTASSRLNLSQAFNSFGTTIGPLIAGWLIFQVFTSPSAHGADSVKIPYLICAAIFAVLAILFKLAHLPEFTNEEQVTKGVGALKHPHTVLGMVAIFMYVGGEVSVGSFVINFLGDPTVAGLNPEAASKYLAFFWGGLMIGRFMGAFSLGELPEGKKRVLIAAVPLVALAVINFTSGKAQAVAYAPYLALLTIAFYVGAASASRMLAVFSALILGLLVLGVTTSGHLAMWSVLAVGMFCSVMWSNIFSLAIEGLGPQKSQASSLLMMSVCGGAILPALQAAIADHVSIQVSFVVPMVAFAYVGFYGIWGYRAGRKLV
ncbi:sugar MFS transporter [Nibricoccus sp. IMCC34717]|uniref:sugar MFS transporter n=1 Tax=Nibricoccus sp. IMCC34717 TaxID=3034021 RepID=UPI00384B073E